MIYIYICNIIYMCVCSSIEYFDLIALPIWWPRFLRRWRCVCFPRRAGSRGRAACEALEAVAMTPKVCNQWLKFFDAKKQFQELMNFIELERNWQFNTMYYETVYINLPNFGLLIQANVVNWVLAKMALRLFQRLPYLECKSSLISAI